MTNLQAELLKAAQEKAIQGKLKIVNGFGQTDFTLPNGEAINTNTRRALVSKGLIKVTYLGNIKEAKHGDITATIEAI